MDLNLGEIVVWCVIGLLAGSVAGALIRGKKEGFGWQTNLVFGLIGAVVGGITFDKLDIHLGLGRITIDLNHLVAAMIGSVAVVLAASFLHGRREKKDRS
jgi:uncharacterized membrane protein YeaQ/YmgE (transglycosylase-associated protein family)